MSSPPVNPTAPKRQPAPATADAGETRKATHLETRYTDLARTSSSSFKPPMTKDGILKKKAQIPQSDSTLYSAFSYIKHFFGGRPAAETSDKATKGVPKKSPKMKKADLVSREREQEIDETPSNMVASVGQRQLATTLTGATNGESLPVETRLNSKSLEREKKWATDDRDLMRSDIPNYTPLRFVENRSTYLHAPEKKGTTSFRITTAPKNNHIPMPTMLSPTMIRGQSPVKKTGVKEAKNKRKRSASPRRNRDSSLTRLRSKSTPDSPSNKARPVSFSASQTPLTFRYSYQKSALQCHSSCDENKPLVANVKTSSKPSPHAKPAAREGKSDSLECVLRGRNSQKGLASETKSASSKFAPGPTSSSKLHYGRKGLPGASGSNGSLVKKQKQSQTPMPSPLRLALTKNKPSESKGPTVLTPTVLHPKINYSCKPEKPMHSPRFNMQMSPTSSKRHEREGAYENVKDRKHLKSYRHTLETEEFSNSSASHASDKMSSSFSQREDLHRGTISQKRPRLFVTENNLQEKIYSNELKTNSTSSPSGDSTPLLTPSEAISPSRKALEIFPLRDASVAPAANAMSEPQRWSASIKPLVSPPLECFGVALIESSLAEDGPHTQPANNSLGVLCLNNKAGLNAQLIAQRRIGSKTMNAPVVSSSSSLASTTLSGLNSSSKPKCLAPAEDDHNWSNSATGESHGAYFDIRFDSLQYDGDTERDTCNSALPHDLTDCSTIPPTCLLSENADEKVYEIAAGPSVIIEKKTLPDSNESTLQNSLSDDLDCFVSDVVSHDSVPQSNSDKYPVKRAWPRNVNPTDPNNDIKNLRSELKNIVTSPMAPLSFRKKIQQEPKPKHVSTIPYNSERKRRQAYHQMKSGATPRSPSGSPKYLEYLSKNVYGESPTVLTPTLVKRGRKNIFNPSSSPGVKKKRMTSLLKRSQSANSDPPKQSKQERLVLKENEKQSEPSNDSFTFSLSNAFESITSTFRYMTSPPVKSTPPKPQSEVLQQEIQPTSIIDKPLGNTLTYISSFLKQKGFSSSDQESSPGTKDKENNSPFAREPPSKPRHMNNQVEGQRIAREFPGNNPVLPGISVPTNTKKDNFTKLISKETDDKVKHLDVKDFQSPNERSPRKIESLVKSKEAPNPSPSLKPPEISPCEAKNSWQSIRVDRPQKTETMTKKAPDAMSIAKRGDCVTTKGPAAKEALQSCAASPTPPVTSAPPQTTQLKKKNNLPAAKDVTRQDVSSLDTLESPKVRGFPTFDNSPPAQASALTQMGELP